MDDQKIPDVSLTPTTVVCAAHGEHLRAQWPKGFLTVGLGLFYAALESPKLLRAARKVAKRPIGKPHPRQIGQVIQKMPLCYFVIRNDIREALTEAGILTKQRCDLCGHIRLAGPYDFMDQGSRVTKIVCIECALDAGERMHAAYPKGPPPRG